ncbi:hypothetical protein TIFTF001_023108 [Ficus carica]|uniref:Uncharacterized protein n=1 Tax=Ficus carica TaxID=3494 RepID=A0AA88AL84_FICCA|nr:hypothetical protein TIFTF001_023108 [Ficus carica]
MSWRQKQLAMCRVPCQLGHSENPMKHLAQRLPANQLQPPVSSVN